MRRTVGLPGEAPIVIACSTSTSISDPDGPFMSALNSSSGIPVVKMEQEVRRWRRRKGGRMNTNRDL